MDIGGQSNCMQESENKVEEGRKEKMNNEERMEGRRFRRQEKRERVESWVIMYGIWLF